MMQNRENGYGTPLYVLDIFTQSKLQKKHPGLLKRLDWRGVANKRYLEGWPTIEAAIKARKILLGLRGSEADRAIRVLNRIVTEEVEKLLIEREETHL